MRKIVCAIVRLVRADMCAIPHVRAALVISANGPQNLVILTPGQRQH